MTNSAKTTSRSGRSTRAAVAVGSMFALAGLAVGLLFSGVAADAAVPAARAAAAESDLVPVAAAELTSIDPAGAVPSERGVPGLGLSIFFGTALTLGAGGVATARLVAQRSTRSVPVRPEI
jgi:hypothetical protein